MDAARCRASINVRLHATRNNVPYLESGRRNTERAADTCRRRPTVSPPRGRTLPSFIWHVPRKNWCSQMKHNLHKISILRLFCNLSRLSVKLLKNLGSRIIILCMTVLSCSRRSYFCFKQCLYETILCNDV